MLPNEQTTRNEIVTLPTEIEALVAAPSRDAARPLVSFVREEKLNLSLVQDADGAFEEALLHRPNLVVVHEHLGPRGGLELCQRLKGNTRTHFLPLIFFSDDDSAAQRAKALGVGVDAVFTPATDGHERKARLWALLRSQELQRREDRRHKAQRSAFKQRGQWIGTFVHDLQNVVSALQANLEFLAQHTPSGASVDLQECARETRQLLQQTTRGLRTVQEYERLEAGRGVIKRHPVRLLDLLLEVRNEVTATGTPSRAAPPVDVAAAEQASLLADPTLLRQALVALSTHLARQPRTTRLSLRALATGQGVFVRIASDGEPIPAEERAELFEPYPGGLPPARGSRRVSPGHGLALALARLVIDLHGGTVTVEDDPGRGSTFVIDLKSPDAAPNPK